MKQKTVAKKPSKQIVTQYVHCDDQNRCSIISKMADGRIFVEPISVRDAAQWTAENKY